MQQHSLCGCRLYEVARGLVADAATIPKARQPLPPKLLPCHLAATNQCVTRRDLLPANLGLFEVAVGIVPLGAVGRRPGAATRRLSATSSWGSALYWIRSREPRTSRFGERHDNSDSASSHPFADRGRAAFVRTGPVLGLPYPVATGLECCHCNVKHSRTFAAGLQWVIDLRAKHRCSART
jgi:hypothetical protein